MGDRGVLCRELCSPICFYHVQSLLIFVSSLPCIALLCDFQGFLPFGQSIVVGHMTTSSLYQKRPSLLLSPMLPIFILLHLHILHLHLFNTNTLTTQKKEKGTKQSTCHGDLTARSSPLGPSPFPPPRHRILPDLLPSPHYNRRPLHRPRCHNHRPRNRNPPLHHRSNPTNHPPFNPNPLHLSLHLLERRSPQHRLRMAEKGCRDPRVHRFSTGAERSFESEVGNG